MIQKTKEFDQFDREIVERCNGRLGRCSDKYYADQFGFRGTSLSDVEYSEEKITVPYDNDPESLQRVRNTGRWLATQPTIIGITNKLISYVIGRGHTYKVNPENQFLGRENKPNHSAISQAKAYTKILNRQLKLMKWMGIQSETYQRIIKDGEVFRRKWFTPTSNPRKPRWRITMMEPETIRNPSHRSEVIDFEGLPDVVKELISSSDPYFGIHGIMCDPEDVTTVYGYWRRTSSSGNKSFEFVNSQSVHHVKINVDHNDPRGVPLFYYGAPHAVQIQEVNGSMVDLCLVQAKHAVIYNYNEGTLPEVIEDIANNRIDDRMANDGRTSGPGEVDSKGAHIEVTGMAKAARNDIEVIQQQQRMIGNLADAPEFMSTADANTGSRSNLISAEGPFDRATQRTQVSLFGYDEDLFLDILEESGMDVEKYSVVPEFPVAATRDKAKEAETEVLLVEAELESVQQARDHLKIDNDRAEIEISQQDRPTLKQQFDAQVKSKSLRSGNPGTGDSARPTQGRQGARRDP